MATNKLTGCIGLARKAGCVVPGTNLICEYLHSKKTLYCICCSCDASDNTVKKLTDKSVFYNVRLIKTEINGDELARSIGKRSKISAIGITDANFAELIVSGSGRS